MKRNKKIIFIINHIAKLSLVQSDQLYSKRHKIKRTNYRPTSVRVKLSYFAMRDPFMTLPLQLFHIVGSVHDITPT